MSNLIMTGVLAMTLVSVATDLVAGPAAGAARKKAASTPKTPTVELLPPDPAVLAALEGLKSANPEDVIISIQTLAIAGTAEGAAPLAALLSSRPRNDITDMILGALGALQNPAAIDAMLPYLHHRRPETRLAAVVALSGFTDPRLPAAFEERLRDSDRDVRAAAAVGLKSIGSPTSVPVLFKAFDKGVTEAVAAIGRHGNEAAAARIAEDLGTLSISTLLPGFKEFLERPDFPESAKLTILDHLFELAGPEVYQFTVSYKATFPPDASDETSVLLRKVNQMLRQIAEK